MPVSVKITFGLLTFICLCWFLFGVLAVTGIITTISNFQVRLLLGGIAIACSLVISGFTILLSRRNRLIYRPSVVLLAAIILVSIMDDLGWVDLSLIGITTVTLVLLIKDRAWYLNNPNSDK
jgi:hypothetical protein